MKLEVAYTIEIGCETHVLKKRWRAIDRTRQKSKKLDARTPELLYRREVLRVPVAFHDEHDARRSFRREAIMLRQYAPVRRDNAPRHHPGEVVLVTFGNYLEKGTDCSPKMRPAILLRVSDCQHLMAGLTTQATCKTTGAARPELHDALAIGLDGRRASYLWSPRPSYVCRLDVRQHLGWIDRNAVEFLAEHMALDQFTLASLWQTTALRSSSTAGGIQCHHKYHSGITPSDDTDANLRPRQPR